MVVSSILFCRGEGIVRPRFRWRKNGLKAWARGLSFGDELEVIKSSSISPHGVPDSVSRAAAWKSEEKLTSTLTCCTREPVAWT